MRLVQKLQHLRCPVAQRLLGLHIGWPLDQEHQVCALRCQFVEVRFPTGVAEPREGEKRATRLRIAPGTTRKIQHRRLDRNLQMPRLRLQQLATLNRCCDTDSHRILIGPRRPSTIRNSSIQPSVIAAKSATSHGAEEWWIQTLRPLRNVAGLIQGSEGADSPAKRSDFRHEIVRLQIIVPIPVGTIGRIPV